MNLDLIDSPTLLIDMEKVGHNIGRMAQKASDHNLRMAAHAKTHQSSLVASLFAQQGMQAITVSSLRMARYFARMGWKQIHLALPPVDAMLTQINELANDTLLSVNISQPAHLNTCLSANAPVRVFIEIDSGQGRTGLSINQLNEIHEFATLCQSHGLDLKGYYLHNGLSYQCQTREQILQLHKKILTAISKLPPLGPCGQEIWFGDTPGCSLAQDFGDVTTLTAGNFVFFDLQQQQLGSCTLDDIALCMVCRIIEKRGTNQLVIHGGAAHFGKDSIYNSEMQPIYGQVVELTENGWNSTETMGKLVAVWQEHGMLEVSTELFGQKKVGQLVGVLPVHSCHTAAAMGQYLSLDGTVVPSIRNWPH